MKFILGNNQAKSFFDSVIQNQKISSNDNRVANQISEQEVQGKANERVGVNSDDPRILSQGDRNIDKEPAMVGYDRLISWEFQFGSVDGSWHLE